MKEFEMRFRKPENIESKLSELGFNKLEKFEMHDLIFEPKEWIPGDDLRPGYFVVRIRLVENKEPRMEMKSFLEGNLWDEIELKIDNPSNAVKILDKISIPRRVISKNREMWKKDDIIICLDDVTHLGEFIEIEGSEEKVKELVNTLELTEPQWVYGRQLFYLEQEGKIKFEKTEMAEVLKRFKYVN